MKRLALILLAATACTSARIPRIGEAGPTVKDPAAEKAYQELFERYSDREAVYDGLDTRVFFAGTSQAPAFVEARAKREAEFKALPQSEADALLKTEMESAATGTEFVVGVHANESKWDDFDKSTSIWRFTLNAGGTDYAPVEVRRIGRSTLNLRGLYPYLDTFWVAYRVRFPKAVASGTVQLRVASALGKATMEFPAE